MVINEEDNEIEAGFGILDAFLVVDDLGFVKKRVARMEFEAYVMVLRTNYVRVVFPH